MSKSPQQLPILIVLSFIVVIAILITFILLNTNTPTENLKEEPNSESNLDSNQNPEVIENPGFYGEYTKEKISGDKTNILFFFASWCPTCNALDEDINSNLDQIPTEVQILKVPYDDLTPGFNSEHAQMKSKYNISYQHTLVLVDEDLNQLKKWSGSGSLQSLLAEVN